MQAIARRHSRRGSALVFATIVLGSLSVLCVVSLYTAAQINRETSSSVDDRRAMQAAEAGISEAVTAVRAGFSGNVGSLALPARFGDGLFWVESSDIGGGARQLRATGMVGSGRATLEVAVRAVGTRDIVEFAILSDEIVRLEERALVDSFDSLQGPYADQPKNNSGPYPHVGSDGDVRGNAAIALSGDAYVYGDAIPGPGASVQGSSRVEGSIAPAGSIAALPVVVVPDVPTLAKKTVGMKSTNAKKKNKGSGKKASKKDGPPEPQAPDAETIGPGVFGFATLKIQANGVLSIIGPATIVVKKLEIKGFGRILVDDSAGSVELYAIEKVDLKDDGRIETLSGCAPGFTLLTTLTKKTKLRKRFQLTGYFVAPKAQLELRDEAQLFGACAARRVDVKKDARVHFDERLRDPGLGAGLVRVFWRRVELPVQAIARHRGDPFAVLGVDRLELPVGEDAWDQSPPEQP